VFKLRFMLRIFTVTFHTIRTFLPIIDLIVIGITRMTAIFLVVGILPTKMKKFLKMFHISTRLIL
jgi:hypothetical protein